MDVHPRLHDQPSRRWFHCYAVLEGRQAWEERTHLANRFSRPQACEGHDGTFHCIFYTRDRLIITCLGDSDKDQQLHQYRVPHLGSRSSGIVWQGQEACPLVSLLCHAKGQSLSSSLATGDHGLYTNVKTHADAHTHISTLGGV